MAGAVDVHGQVAVVLQVVVVVVLRDMVLQEQQDPITVAAWAATRVTPMVAVWVALAAEVQKVHARWAALRATLMVAVWEVQTVHTVVAWVHRAIRDQWEVRQVPMVAAWAAHPALTAAVWVDRWAVARWVHVVWEAASVAAQWAASVEVVAWAVASAEAALAAEWAVDARWAAEDVDKMPLRFSEM